MVNASPLRGLRVLDTATLYAGPLVSTLLADHGAEVIKVEPPGGDPYRHHPSRMWPLLARGKRSVVLDLRSEAGVETIRRLARNVDVIVLNMPLPLLERRGLGHGTLQRINPELVIVQVTGYGLDGPYAERPGNGSTAEALSGLTSMTGEAAGRPMLASVPLGDAVTGFAGAFGVLVACYDRLVHGGGGQVVDVNPLDTLLHVVGPMLTEYDGGEPPRRLGGGLTGSLVRNVYGCADGRWVTISLSTPRHLRDMAVLVGLRGGPDGVLPSGLSGELDGAVAAWAAARPRDAVLAELVGRRLPVAPVNDAREVTEDPHVVARRGVVPVTTTESGVVLSPAPAPRLVGRPMASEARTPAIGEHQQLALPLDGGQPV